MQVKRVVEGAMASPSKGIRVWLIERNVLGTHAAQSG
jgi:hypothetical protein